MSQSSPADLAATVTDLQALMVTTPQVQQFLAHLTGLAAQLAGVTSCSVTVGSEEPWTVTPTDDLAARADEVQYREDAGPCLHAIRTASVTVVQDLDEDRRWPGYCRQAREAGVRSSMSLPLTVAGETIGGLNVYSTRVGAFDDTLQETLGVFAAQAAAALTMVRRTEHFARTRLQLEEALSSRALIDQALGILMAQQRCTAEEALALLRRHSQTTNRKVRDVAAELVERVSGAPPAPGTPFAPAPG